MQLVFGGAVTWVPIAISLASLAVSGLTFWWAHLYRGRLRMVQPQLAVFGREPGSDEPRLWLRTLLHSTSARGHLVESMHVQVHAPSGSVFRFGLWGVRAGEKLTYGSGVLVTQTGDVSEHRFMLGNEPGDFLFWPGAYRCEFYATILGGRRPKPRPVAEVRFTVSEMDSATFRSQREAALWLFWNAETRTYVGRLDRGLPRFIHFRPSD
jgi:hypothetical protein